MQYIRDFPEEVKSLDHEAIMWSRLLPTHNKAISWD